MGRVKDFYERYNIIQILIFCGLGFVTMIVSLVALYLFLGFLPALTRIKIMETLKPWEIFLIYYGIFCSVFFVSIHERVTSWQDIFWSSITTSIFSREVIYTYKGDFSFVLLGYLAKFLVFILRVILFIICLVYVPIIKLSYYLYTSPIYFVKEML